MIATCKLCQTIITPVTVLPLKPAQLAKIPPEQVELMKFSAAVTDHARTAHPEFLAYVQQLAGNFIGHCVLSTVDPVGENNHQFRAMCDADDAQLRAIWEAMPNPPDPDMMAQLNELARETMETARKEDNAAAVVGAGAGTGAGGINPAPIDLSTITPPPPGKIRLT